MQGHFLFVYSSNVSSKVNQFNCILFYVYFSCLYVCLFSTVLDFSSECFLFSFSVSQMLQIVYQLCQWRSLKQTQKAIKPLLEIIRGRLVFINLSGRRELKCSVPNMVLHPHVEWLLHSVIGPRSHWGSLDNLSVYYRKRYRSLTINGYKWYRLTLKNVGLSSSTVKACCIIELLKIRCTHWVAITTLLYNFLH